MRLGRRQDSRNPVLQEEDEEEVQQEQEVLAQEGSATRSKRSGITGSRFFSVYELMPDGKKEKKSKGKRK